MEVATLYSDAGGFVLPFIFHFYFYIAYDLCIDNAGGSHLGRRISHLLTSEVET